MKFTEMTEWEEQTIRDMFQIGITKWFEISPMDEHKAAQDLIDRLFISKCKLLRLKTTKR